MAPAVAADRAIVALDLALAVAAEKGVGRVVIASVADLAATKEVHRVALDVAVALSRQLVFTSAAVDLSHLLAFTSAAVVIVVCRPLMRRSGIAQLLTVRRDPRSVATRKNALAKVTPRRSHRHVTEVVINRMMKMIIQLATALPLQLLPNRSVATTAASLAVVVLREKGRPLVM